MNKLLFVYNANSGIGNMAMDIAHKLFSPETYACNLCTITFDTFSENKTWKQFREQSDIDMSFFHIDEFELKHMNQKFDYPIILKQTNTKLHSFLSKECIDKLTSVEALITAIETKFKHQ